MPDLMPDAELQAALEPLGKLIARTVHDTPILIGRRPDALVAALTLAVAGYMGRQVTGLPEQLAELVHLRDCVDRVRDARSLGDALAAVGRCDRQRLTGIEVTGA